MISLCSAIASSLSLVCGYNCRAHSLAEMELQFRNVWAWIQAFLQSSRTWACGNLSVEPLQDCWEVLLTWFCLKYAENKVLSKVWIGFKETLSWIPLGSQKNGVVIADSQEFWCFPSNWRAFDAKNCNRQSWLVATFKHQSDANVEKPH
jgi:hypothetical protein